MPRRRALYAALSTASTLLVACGETATTAQCRTPAPATPASAVSGPLTAHTDRGVLQSGGTVHVVVDVVGPASFNAPCDAPVSAVVVDATDLHVAAVSAPAPKGTPCGAVSLPAGDKAHYELAWTADITLPSGGYRLVVTLGDQPPVTLPVALGPSSLVCS
jgi:hypothetical protein